MLTTTWETESLCLRLSFMPGKLKRIITVPSLRELSFLLERQDILQRNKAGGNSEKSFVLGARLLGFYCQLCRLLTASSWASTLVILRFSSKNYIRASTSSALQGCGEDQVRWLACLRTGNDKVFSTYKLYLENNTEYYNNSTWTIYWVPTLL